MDSRNLEFFNNIETILASKCPDAHAAMEYYKKYYHLIHDDSYGNRSPLTNSGALDFISELADEVLKDNFPIIRHMMCIAHSGSDICLEDFFLFIEQQTEIWRNNEDEGKNEEEHLFDNFERTINNFIVRVRHRISTLELDDETKNHLFSDSRILMGATYVGISGDFEGFIRRPWGVYNKHYHTRDYEATRRDEDILRALSLRNMSGHTLVEEKRQLAELAKNAITSKKVIPTPAPKPVKKQGFLRKLFS
ncbi:MAG: hypothetical protein GY804_07035 [Alphaproteobacteria bacterium]|nr:hypothetical protein [Alphaproteobacteria bacterium]